MFRPPGSHRTAAGPLMAATEVPNVFGVASDPALVDERLVVAVPMQAGDVSAHHPALLHCSDADPLGVAPCRLGDPLPRPPQTHHPRQPKP